MANIIRTEIEKMKSNDTLKICTFMLCYVLCTTLWGFLNKFIINFNKCVNIDSV